MYGVGLNKMLFKASFLAYIKTLTILTAERWESSRGVGGGGWGYSP